ncbi:MAG TPA: hypothetical protein PLB89_17665 [Flavobacteriales bacterium]|nr:hypothetical protein [Flavobacteriales bacterium]
MRNFTIVLATTALLLVACSTKPGKEKPDYRQVYNRAVELTKNSLKYPDDATFPIFDSVDITATGDTVKINFHVLAANGMGVRSKAETKLTFKVDSCAHLLSGWVVDDVMVDPDPVGRPCSPAAIKAWEDKLLAQALEDARVRRQVQRAKVVEDSARFGSNAIVGQKISGSHKYGGKTKVTWTPLVGLLEEARKDAAKQMQPDAELQTVLSSYYAVSEGGRIRIDIERSTIGAANWEYFTIVVQDSTGSEIFRKALDSDVPEYSSGDWWNINLVNIPGYVRPPFNVFVIDQLEDAPFNFRIEARR